MTPSELDDLKNKVDILALCSMLGINLKKSNHGYVGLCLFWDHDDSDYSFVIDSVKKEWHCSCGRKGDVMDLVQNLKGWSFEQAFYFLDDHFNDGKYSGRLNDDSL